MSKAFLDSNVCVYAFSNNSIDKQEKALVLMNSQFIISPQVVIETYNVCSKKYKIAAADCEEIVLRLLEIGNMQEIDGGTILKAIMLKRKYQVSFLDSMILSAALQAKCTILYTEDMQHGLIVDVSMKIENPFV